MSASVPPNLIKGLLLNYDLAPFRNLDLARLYAWNRAYTVPALVPHGVTPKACRGGLQGLIYLHRHYPTR